MNNTKKYGIIISDFLFLKIFVDGTSFSKGGLPGKKPIITEPLYEL